MLKDWLVRDIAVHEPSKMAIVPVNKEYNEIIT